MKAYDVFVETVVECL